MPSWGTLLAQTLFRIGVGGVLLCGLLFLGEEGLIRYSSRDQAIAFFPYFQVHQLIFLENDGELSAASLAKLAHLYRYSSEFYHYLASTSSPADQAEVIEKIYELDPWQRISQDPVTYYLEQKNWSKVEERLNDLTAFLETPLKKGVYSREEIIYKQKKLWAKQLLTLADHQAQEGRIKEAAANTVKAQFWDEWTLAHHPLLLFSLTDWSERETFLQETKVIPPTYWADYREDLANFWLESTARHLAATDWDQAQLTAAVQRTLEFAEMRTHLLWERTTAQELPAIQQALERGDLATAQQRADHLFVVWQAIERYPFVHPPFRAEANQHHATTLATMYRTIMERKLSAGEYDLALELQAFIQLAPPTTAEVRERLLPLLQEAAELAVAQNRFTEAHQILKQMSDLDPSNYWVLTQQGNLYLLNNQFEQSAVAFEACRQQVDYYHDDCEGSIDQLKTHRFTPKRFYEVGEFIKQAGRAI